VQPLVIRELHLYLFFLLGIAAKGLAFSPQFPQSLVFRPALLIRPFCIATLLGCPTLATPLFLSPGWGSTMQIFWAGSITRLLIRSDSFFREISAEILRKGTRRDWFSPWPSHFSLNVLSLTNSFLILCNLKPALFFHSFNHLAELSWHRFFDIHFKTQILLLNCLW
jgi:hypothetical protein